MSYIFEGNSSKLDLPHIHDTRKHDTSKHDTRKHDARKHDTRKHNIQHSYIAQITCVFPIISIIVRRATNANHIVQNTVINIDFLKRTAPIAI